MAVSSNDIIQYNGKNIRRGYGRLLTIADAHIHFQLNSAFRSLVEQWRLYRLYKAGKGPLAAFPGTSTHNKKSWKQGLDIRWDDGGCERFRKWAATHGMYFDLTVVGEKWHVNARQDYTNKINALWADHQDHLERVERLKKRKRRA